MPGHLKEKCFKLVGYPPGHRFAKGRNVVANVVGQSSDVNQSSVMKSLSNLTIPPYQCKQVLEMLVPQLKWQINNIPRAQTQSQSQDAPTTGYSVLDAFAFSGNYSCSKTKIGAAKWIMDTGASEHIVCSIWHLISIFRKVKAPVILPNGDTIEATNVGTVRLSNTLVLTEVLVVPCFTFNLISASKLTLNHNCFLIFLHQYCFVQNLLTQRTIGMGKLEDGPYVFQISAQQLHDKPSISCLHSGLQHTDISENNSPVFLNSNSNSGLRLQCNKARYFFL